MKKLEKKSSEASNKGSGDEDSDKESTHDEDSDDERVPKGALCWVRCVRSRFRT